MSEDALNVMQAAQSYDSVDSAIDAMFDGKTDADVQDNAPVRAPDGKFEAKKPAEVVDIKTAKPVEPKQEQSAEEDDEDFEWEIPAEKEGEAPRRVKASETLKAYEELPKLKAELENVKKATPPPADYVALSGEVMKRRSQLIEQIGILEELINPQRPDPNQYADNPEAYRDAMARFERDVRHLQGVQQAKAKALKEQQEAEQVVARAQVAKSVEEIYGFWPELKDDKAREATIMKLEKITGFPAAELVNAVDPRMWKILKGYMEFTESKEKQAAAVQVARSKPKLVKGNARQATTTADMRRNSASERFGKSRSVEDAIEMLLG